MLTRNATQYRGAQEDASNDLADHLGLFQVAEDLAQDSSEGEGEGELCRNNDRMLCR